MNIEFETRVLEIDPEAIMQQLRALGAEEKAQVSQKRWVFDINCRDGQQPGQGEWIRLRQAGETVKLTYKNKNGFGIADTTELETEVTDFDQTAEILSKLRCFTGQYYQENRRKQFFLNDLEFDLDYWPMIPPFLEIEGASEAAVREGLKLLGLEGKDCGHLGLISVYKKYGINLHDYKELKFE